jgi:hypothetical protein
MERVYREEFAIAWLLVLHVLADVALGVLPTNNAEWLATDFLSAAIPRCQIALLAIWLALGETRLSWRICGFIAGSFFIFSLRTRTTWPAQYGIGAKAIWMDEEWRYYFRPFESGDYLVKAPLIAVGIVVPLAAMRWREICSAVTSRPIRELIRFRNLWERVDEALFFWKRRPRPSRLNACSRGPRSTGHLMGKSWYVA